MRKRDRERCRAILRAQRELILEKTARARNGELEIDRDDSPDEMDMALAESNLSFAGRIRELENKLLGTNEEKLERQDQGDYGDCVNCGEEIGVKRLVARPVATLCIDCKDEQERFEGHRD